MAKKRLDVLLFEKGLCPSRERAKTAIMEGIVYIAGQKAGKAGDMVDENAELEVRGNENAFVSRGGKKIEKALNYFNIDPTDLVVMDVGASTGGFTDCLLRRGARKVYSIDVGYGQLAWSLRQDPRVKCMERTNIRYVTPDMLEETPSLCVIDVSFISLKLVLPVVSSLLTEDGHVANLIKPQFEAGKGKKNRGDCETHRHGRGTENRQPRLQAGIQHAGAERRSGGHHFGRCAYPGVRLRSLHRHGSVAGVRRRIAAYLQPQL